MKQVTLSEHAQQGNADAIANLIKKLITTNAAAIGVSHRAINDLSVEADLSDGRLSLNLITTDMLEPRKIVVLIRSQLARMGLKFITRVKVYGWLKDSEQPEQRLTWNQEFKLDLPVKPPKYKSQVAMPAPHPKGIAQVNPANAPTRSMARINGMAIANAVPPITSRRTDVPIQRGNRANNSVNGAYAKPSNQNQQNQVGGFSPVAGQVNQAPTAPHNSVPSPIDPSGASPVISGNAPVKRKKYSTLPAQLIFVGMFIAIAGMGMGMGIRVLTVLRQANVETSQTSPQTDRDISTSDPTDPNLAVVDDTAPQDLKITLTEFEQINQGMTIEEVEAVIGAPGKLIANSSVGDVSGQVYSWRNDKGSNAIIEFRNGKVVAKAQAGLS
ncbi:hypothetical protein Pse7367_2525 [Thalassoporum mexicanum PCC 7367]|uniref:hypothetical protein n=1 Tax=Thalassoporum mexicanum TaxID=3457544 RepID=UPI00029F9ABF|nr:hypothetical protein [Pseudanabaena sp. PCC 7367]AFY70785.1 hypothetical protein Pse7367_2525 [Pseudanabaena sp. PCC 7367]